MVVSSYRFLNGKCTQGVVLQEYVWVSDASVNMSFSRNVNNCIYLVDQTVHELWVTNVTLYESVAFIIFNVMQIRWVSAHAYLVNVNQFAVRVLFKNKPTKVAPDKS